VRLFSANIVCLAIVACGSVCWYIKRLLSLLSLPIQMGRKGRKKRLGPVSGSSTSARSMAPPQFHSNVMLSHRFRFVSTSATATAITPNSLLAAAGNMCTDGNTLVVSFASSVKVKRVAVWTPPGSQGSAATCSVDWVGFNNSPNIEFSDSTVSVAKPAVVDCSPPPMSLASFWQVSSTTTLFTLTAPVGSIIDVILDLVLSDGDAEGLATAISTGTINLTYYLSLDPNATHRYTPVSLTTTT